LVRRHSALVESRSEAAAAVKPIINWQSFALTTDFYVSAIRYWFAAPATRSASWSGWTTNGFFCSPCRVSSYSGDR